MKTIALGVGLIIMTGAGAAFAQEEPAGANDSAGSQETSTVGEAGASPAPASEVETLELHEDWPRPGEEPSSFGVFIEPLFAVFGFFEGDVLVGVSNKVAVGASGQYFDFDLGVIEIAGFGLGVGAQFFPLSSGQLFDGFYLYPGVKYQEVAFTDPESADKVEATYVTPQFIVGYQWDWHPFSVRLGGGMEYSFGELSSTFSDQSVDFSGFDIETDFTVGLTF